MQVNSQDHFTSLINDEFPKLKINKIGMPSLKLTILLTICTIKIN